MCVGRLTAGLIFMRQPCIPAGTSIANDRLSKVIYNLHNKKGRRTARTNHINASRWYSSNRKDSEIILPTISIQS